MAPLRYRITDAALQLGDKPPFKCVDLLVRNQNGNAQIKIDGCWWNYPKDEPAPTIIREYLGHPVAGIATTWEIDCG